MSMRKIASEGIICPNPRNPENRHTQTQHIIFQFYPDFR